MKRILIITAHPDDEAFLVGGTVAKYTKAGNEVSLLCATKGEAGSTGYSGIKREELGEVRTKELTDSCQVLGIHEVKFLENQKDGKLKESNPGEIEDGIFKYMTQVLPDVVITFDPTGISNHPDHIRMCFSTTYSFQEYVKWLDSVYEEKGIQGRYEEVWLKRIEKMVQSHIEPKLYYACMPESIAMYAKKAKIIPVEAFGKPWNGVADKKITTVIDIHPFASKKLEALKCHTSQIADVDRFVASEGNPLFDREYFILRMHGKEEVFMGKNDEVSDKL
ncbi:PIG-L family deacetylase [Candidatus Gottesmanbacteria bacterium]|nr:PIG-L family deacetylase [Candidatus Gottesmanbacteria bacterium]